MQLKNDESTDGKVLGSAGKAKWNVEWNEGDQRGKTTEQSTKSICLWRVDLAAIDVGDAAIDVGANKPPRAEEEVRGLRRNPRGEESHVTRCDTRILVSYCDIFVLQSFLLVDQ